MFSQKINITALRESSRNVMSNARKLWVDNFKHFDFEEVVGKDLKELGYVYTLDVKTGEFAITAAPGFYIRAKWKGDMYWVHIEINKSGLSVNTESENNVFTISPFGIKNYKSVFDKMIADLRAEFARYESATKGNMGAKLLRPVISRCLRKHKLTETKLEKCDEDPGQFWLLKKLFGNVFVRTKINFDDFEDGIVRIAEAYNSVPDWLKDCTEIEISTKDVYHWTNQGLGKIGSLDNRKMSYGTLPPFDDSLNSDYATTKLSKVLDEYGFTYYVEEGGKYNIFLNEYRKLCKENDTVRLVKHTGEILSTTHKIDDIDFIRLLNMLTWGCTRYGYWGDVDWDFGALVGKSILYALPISVSCRLIPGNDMVFVDGSRISYRVTSMKSGWVSVVWHIVKAFHTGEKLLNVFPDVETIVKERYGNHSILRQ